MHFTLVVFSESPDDLVRMLAPFGDDRFDYYRSIDPSEGWFISKTGERASRGFAQELHFDTISNLDVARKAKIIPSYVDKEDAPAVISNLLGRIPYAFVTPHGEWSDADDFGMIRFYKDYKGIVSDAKRHNYHVTAVDCHI